MFPPYAMIYALEFTIGIIPLTADIAIILYSLRMPGFSILFTMI